MWMKKIGVKDLGGIRKEGFVLHWSWLKFRIPNQIIFYLVEL